MMNFRGKSQRKAIYPSFTLVVNRHILRRIVRVPRKRLVWTSIPYHHPHDATTQKGYGDDWTMVRECVVFLREILPCLGVNYDWQKTVDYRNEEEHGRVRGPVVLPEITTSMDSVVGDVPPAGPEQGTLHPMDDDALTDVSDLDLDDELTVEDDGQPIPVRRTSKGARILFVSRWFIGIPNRGLRVLKGIKGFLDFPSS
ncbi:hypothetical protein EW145_g5004 [Phellinidium pouzarii]|uniref:Uncharacterized protein n=1 Tax=Phellinidium pouzarii TaxID=167371 RepID=A0A4S4L6E0_9AGAM|nr:hypothetical protein EW145_g5004 [Phellinidium pouzarii]